MNTKPYQIQPLLESDLTPGCLDAFARRQVVQNVWRRKDGQWVIVPEPFIDDWDLKERGEIAEHLRQYTAEGGAVFAALGAQGEIIAFADTINAAGAAAGEFDNINNLQNAFREDEVVPSYPRDEILKNVDGGEDGFFPVRKRQ